MALPVSVIVPYHDAERHAPEALASVAAQTAAPAEVIVVDDGSRRPAAEVVDASGLDVRLVGLPSNQGPGPARNAGVAASTQPYLAFLDADDVWAPDKLETQHAFMAAWPELDATHAEVVFFFADGTEKQREPGPRELDPVTALSNHVMITPTIMMKRTAFDALGGFDPRFRCTQDWELQIRMAQAGMRVQYLPEVLARVRREGHGNHSWNWRCYLAGHMRILWKHRSAYVERGGYRLWVHRHAYELWRAGHRQGRFLGECMKIPHRIGI